MIYGKIISVPLALHWNLEICIKKYWIFPPPSSPIYVHVRVAPLLCSSKPAFHSYLTCRYWFFNPLGLSPLSLLLLHKVVCFHCFSCDRVEVWFIHALAREFFFSFLCDVYWVLVGRGMIRRGVFFFHFHFLILLWLIGVVIIWLCCSSCIVNWFHCIGWCEGSDSVFLLKKSCLGSIMAALVRIHGVVCDTPYHVLLFDLHFPLYPVYATSYQYGSVVGCVLLWMPRVHVHKFWSFCLFSAFLLLQI